MTYTLYQHQSEAVDKAMSLNYFGFIMETGTGKTISFIETAKRKGFKRILVICPRSAMRSTWEEEVLKFMDHKPFVIYHTKMDQRKKLIEQSKKEEMSLSIINFDVIKKLSKELIAAKYDCVCVDESSYIREPSASRTKEIIRLGDSIPSRYIMTGTISPNNDMGYFTQMRFLSPDIFGKMFYPWRAKYFMPQQITMGAKRFTEWRPKKEGRQLILDQVSKYTYTAMKDKCLDLPDRVYSVRDVSMTPKQEKAYNKMKNQYIFESKDSAVLAANHVAKIMKLRQITAGFIYDEMGELKEWISDAKINALKEVLTDINDQCIIWYGFQAEAEKIGKLLDVQPYTSITSDEKRYQQIVDFKEGRQQYLVAHPASLGYSLTLTNCRYCIWTSLPYNLEHYSQANDRIYRIGQERKVQMFHLNAPGSIDDLIYKVLNKKTDINNAIMAFLQESN